MTNGTFRQGAKTITTTSSPSTDPTLAYPPIILTDVEPSMNIYSQETFGPGLVVVRAKNEEDAIRIANGEYGLSSSVWTNDYKQALRVAKRIEASAVSWRMRTHPPRARAVAVCDQLIATKPPTRSGPYQLCHRS